MQIVNTCCIFSKSRCGLYGLGVCRCLFLGEVALTPISERLPFIRGDITVPPSAPWGIVFSSLVEVAVVVEEWELLTKESCGRCLWDEDDDDNVSILLGGEMDLIGLWASKGGDVRNSTGGRVPVVRTHTSSSLLPGKIKNKNK